MQLPFFIVGRYQVVCVLDWLILAALNLFRLTLLGFLIVSNLYAQIQALDWIRQLKPRYDGIRLRSIPL